MAAPTELCGAGAGDGVDNNYNGCIDEGCVVGQGKCICTAECDSPRCDPRSVATCNPRKNAREICFNGEDDNCNGVVDEGCGFGGAPFGPAPKGGGGGESCGGQVGADPILLAARAAVTEPFADFSVDTLAQLAVIRTYSSADWSLQGGPAGVFGPGWRHQWEAFLSCEGDYCTVTQANRAGYLFRRTGTAPSLDGLETWDVYARGDTDVLRTTDGHQVLVRRFSGVWSLFQSDGSELRFGTVCDTCGGSDPMCLDPRQGGRARLIDYLDAKGTGIHFTYDRPGGLLVALADDLGHALELRSTSACTDGLARELRYDGQAVATYTYEGANLVTASDSEGVPLRSYAYLAGGYLRAVLNEASAAIAEFSYDINGDAIGVIDSASDVSVQYGDGGLVTVTERHGNGSTATSQRSLDGAGNVTSISDGCACGPAITRQWVDRAVVCEVDAQNHARYVKRDDSGRVIYEASYVLENGLTCPLAGVAPVGSLEEWRSYSLSRPIAVGLSIPLAQVTGIQRGSESGPTEASETFDYDPTPQAIDPEGYSCTEAPLPVGAVMCRRISYGSAMVAGNWVQEKTATFFSYDSRGRLVRTFGPLFVERINEWGQVVPPPPNDIVPVEERAYWSDGETLARRGRLREVRRYPGGGAPSVVTTTDYDAFGPYSITDASGVTLFVKDGRGRTRFTLAGGVQLETRFYDGSKPRIQAATGGVFTRFSYDSRGRPSLTERLDRDPDAGGGDGVVLWSESTTLDEAGNPVHRERRDASGAVTWREDREYDVQHRLLAVVHPEQPAHRRTWSYDATGFLAEVVDEEGRKTTFQPDSHRRVAAVIQAGLDANGSPVQSQVASYTYSGRSLAAVIDGKGLQTSYLHTAVGAVSQVGSQTITEAPMQLEYDARGNLVRRQRYQLVVDYSYDGLDRVRTIAAHDTYDAKDVAYELRYDENGYAGKLTSVVEPERTVTYAYDGFGRLTSETVAESGVPAPLVTGLGYDAGGRSARIDYPSGLSVSFDRDATGEVMQVRTTDAMTIFADAVTYWPGGPIRSFTFGSGDTFAAVVNARYEPATIRSGPLALDYTMTTAGDVGSIREGAASASFSYDFRDRLVAFSPGFPAGTDLTNEYAPAFLGEKTDRIKRSGTFTGTMLTSGYAFDYDYQTNLSSIGKVVNGNVTSAVCLRHDPLGRLVIVGAGTNGGGDGRSCLRDADVTSVVARFRYDSRNRRVARWLASTGEWTYFVHGAAGELLSELRVVSGAWVPVRDYVWLEGRPLAQIEYGLSGERSVYYVHADHLGTPRKLTSSQGVVVWSATTQPYGEVNETITPDPATSRSVVTNLRLPGQYDERLLAAAGLSGLQGPYYNWNRWYLPSMGRYLELDPEAFKGNVSPRSETGGRTPEWYGYAGANPIRHTDPDGLYTKDSDCTNYPSEDDVRNRAQAITETCLRTCVIQQVNNAHLNCGFFKAMFQCWRKPTLLGTGQWGTCQAPGKNVWWCERPVSQQCQVNTLVHEFAHNCGWHHDDEKGVPGTSGILGAAEGCFSWQ